MKELVAVLFLCVLSQSISFYFKDRHNIWSQFNNCQVDGNDFVCPSPDGQFPIPGQCCQEYFLCVDSNPIPSTCPGSLIFVPELNSCNLPDRCITTTMQTTTPTTQSPNACQVNPDDFVCPDPNGQFPIPGQCCHEYFYCIDGSAIPAVCPGDTVFVPELGSCNLSNRCVTTTIETTVPSTTPSANVCQVDPSDFVCPNPDGQFPIPGQCCHEYFYCIDGSPIPALCPGDTVFVPELGSCNLPSRCLTTTTETTIPTTTEPANVCQVEPSDFVCPNPDGQFPIPGQCCPEYFVCIGGNPLAALCPGGTVFVPELGSCNFPTRCGITTTQPTTSTTSTTTQAPNLCQVDINDFVCPNADGLFGIPGQCCGEYFLCIVGNPISGLCPNGTVFVEAISSCNTLEMCQTPPPPLSCEANVSSFTCPSPNGNFPVPGQCCNEFFVCIAGIPHSSKCPSNTVFNPDKEDCDEPQLCVPPTTPAWNGTTPSYPDSCKVSPEDFECPGQNGKFPIPGQCCSEHFTCVFGVPYPSSCLEADQPIFNPQTGQCDTQDNCNIGNFFK